MENTKENMLILVKGVKFEVVFQKLFRVIIQVFGIVGKVITSKIILYKKFKVFFLDKLFLNEKF